MPSVTSRYRGVEQAELVDAEGRRTPYLRRRFPGDAPAPGLLGAYQVDEGERLDQLAARFLGDPELFWVICDVNGALCPDELTAHAYRRLLIPLGL